MLSACCTAAIACKDAVRVLHAADAFPTRSAPLIDMYKAAGGIIMGKAALDELQDGGNSVNPTTQYAGGLITTMLNAYNQTRIAGGLTLANKSPQLLRWISAWCK